MAEEGVEVGSPVPVEELGAAHRPGLYADARDDGRLLRVTWHEAEGVVNLSLWRTDRCVGTFRLGVDEVPRLVRQLLDPPGADAPTAAGRHARASRPR